MNIKNFISLLLLLLFAVALVQCAKDKDQSERVLVGNTINELESRSILSSVCYIPGIDCDSFQITDTIEIPGYCGTHLVRYTVWICYGEPLVFTGFRADPLVACDSLWNSWLNLSDNALAVAYDKYEYAASLIAEKEFMKTIMNPLIFKCPTSYVGAHFYKNLCYQWCKEVVGRPGDPYFIFTMGQVFCGRNCCRRIITYCYDENGVLQASNPVFSSVGLPECFPNPIGDCRGQLIGQCERTCGVP